MRTPQIETARRSRADHHSRWSTGYIEVDPKLCDACGECVEVCRREVLRVVGFLFHKHARVRNPEKCCGCGKCAAACLNGAIVLCERAYEEERSASLMDTANV
jgi:NAD-dependent dihydropyrimidine dehydrogenase PreA subunit